MIHLPQRLHHGVCQYYFICELSFSMPGHGLTRLGAAISAELAAKSWMNFLVAVMAMPIWHTRLHKNFYASQ
jgi:hypothetical protein